ncbi:MAG: response regulator transcription factor [Flavobacteriales bacterium]|nr:response regulator transcription factor [Flavobacteriales bacterium]
MNKVRAIIVDDDVFTREDLREKLAATDSGIDVIADFEFPLEAVTYIRKHAPDLLFLDIRLPGMSGFEMLDQLGPVVPAVIFITSYNEYAIQAIRYSALDYLLKPISEVELNNALVRFRATQHVSADRFKSLRHNLQVNNHEAFQLVIPSRTGDRSFAVRDIVRLEADSNYTWMYLVDGSKFLTARTLKEMEDLLQQNRFIRTHKSHLVNRQHVLQLTSTGELLLIDQTRIEVSRRRLNEVRELLR